MNVALCLSGHLRKFENCLDNLKNNIIKPYNPDIFAMTWLDSRGFNNMHANSPAQQDTASKDPGFNAESGTVDWSYLQWALSELQPCDVHLDHYFLHDEKFQEMVDRYPDGPMPFAHHRPKGTVSQNWCRLCSVGMMHEFEKTYKKNYDWVIVTRYDVNVLNMVDLNILDPDVIHFSAHLLQDQIILEDAVVIGSSENMYTWSKQFHALDKMAEVGTLNWDPHAWGSNWLYMNNIGVDYSLSIDTKTER